MMKPQLVGILLSAIVLSACSQKFTVSVNDQNVYDPRPNQTAQRFSDPGLQACVNLTVQQTGVDVDKIKVLACPDWQIAEIESIGTLRSLQFLDLSDNNITSLAPVTTLRNLSSISINNNRISDAAPLLRIATLTSATLNGNADIPCQQIESLRAKLKANLVSDQCKP
jgi:Leucine-rich repeat (LRR) protein